MHSLLRRQLQKITQTPDQPPSREGWNALLAAIDRTYTQADQDRYTLERSIEISSGEMQQLYANLRRASESELARESGDRHRSLVRNAPYGICHVRADGRLLAVNPALVTMLGYSSEEELLAVDVDTLYQEWLASGEIARQYEQSGRIDSVELGWK